MTTLSVSEAARLPYAPSKQYLSQLKKRRPRPKFFINMGGGDFEIDADHKEFRALLKNRASRQGATTSCKTTVDINATLEAISQAKREKLRQQIRSLRISNAAAELKLRQESENLIDVNLCTHIFDSYLSRLQGATGPMVKRLQVEVEELLSQEMVPGADPRTLAKRISRRIVEAEEEVIHSTKVETAQAVETWRNTDGRSDI
ncbi:MULTISPECIES: hypothetical protein [Marispirochaeta]|uniref:hypothetical protein n=1 Tax=Marispirochaeta TaxID=1911565 RepID=UPI0029C8ED3A|nr:MULTISPECIES: hypothetical protein [Marispirochaeta]